MPTRLIERYLPIAALGEESARERRLPTSLPPINFLHVWWARRPLIAARAAILGSLLPEDTDRQVFLEALGIHGDPVATRIRLDVAKRTGENLGTDPYGYPRAFLYDPRPTSNKLLPSLCEAIVVDPTAGGGAIPFEAVRLGAKTIANDLNPVASIILKATVEYPVRYGQDLLTEFKSLSASFLDRVSGKFAGIYPEEGEASRVDSYLWARTIVCPHCAGRVPLSPNWRLSPSGAGIRLVPRTQTGPGDETRHCATEIVEAIDQHSPGTVSDGDALCPFPDCRRPIDAEDVKGQAVTGEMGDQIIAVAGRRPIEKITKTGKKRPAWERYYRAPDEDDAVDDKIAVLLRDKQLEWEAMDVLPSERVGDMHPKFDVKPWGMKKWTDFFSPRQLYVHGLAVETFRQMVDDDRAKNTLTDVRAAAYVYLSFALDKLRDYNSRMTRWHPNREVMVNTFDRHDFAFKWSYAEMALAATGRGFQWALGATEEALSSIVNLIQPSSLSIDLFSQGARGAPDVTTTNRSGADLSDIQSNSVDAIIMDPPYGANVMYAELSDFFYVWLKRTAGLLEPGLFVQYLTDKDSEAVANKGRFRGQKRSDDLANRDYQQKMSSIFSECRRIVKENGIMTVMFTHKETSAWDALASGLIQAGFTITASWPINTEPAGSLHIKDKAAANSTIFLICRPRAEARSADMYWEDVEPLVARAVRTRIAEFQEAGIRGVDLYLASFGPALEEFSKHWPLTRGTPAPTPKARRGKQSDMFEDFDPYAVRPEDALNAARREVKAWRLSQLASRKAHADMDPATAWVALAWDAFRAPVFAFDEGLRLARAVGLDLDTVIGRLAEKKGSDIKLWDSATRVAKGTLGPADGSRGMIDALHHATHVARQRGVEAARDLLEQAGVLNDEEFKVALEVMLEVLPPSKAYSGIEADAAVKPAADDFDALEKLRRIVYADQIDAPEQLSLYAAFAEAAE